MSQTFAATIDSNPIYAQRAEEDENGVNIDSYYAKKTDLPDGVPSVTSSDDGKVLKASYSGGQGSYAWETESGGSTELFEAVYGTTTYADVTAAIAAKKTVFCRVSAANPTRMAFLAYIGSTTVEFQYYRSLSSHSATNQVDEVYVYTVSSSGWTTTTRKAGCNIAAGTGLSRAYSSDTITLSVSDPIPTVTSSDNGKVLKASYSGGQGSYAWETESGGGGLPSSTSADEGKALVVDSNGDPQWTTPKSVAAGTGIKITEASNTVTLAEDRTTLWSGTYSGTIESTNTITLSESAANFEYVEIMNGGGYKSVYKFAGSSGTWSFMQTYAGANGTTVYANRYVVSGTTVTCVNSNSFSANANGLSNWTNRSSMNVGETQLTKVVGVNRIYT